MLQQSGVPNFPGAALRLSPGRGDKRRPWKSWQTRQDFAPGESARKGAASSAGVAGRDWAPP